ncbi:Aste57867_10732 [Aphanomyces stellatus]|uniref:Aste57867_10732 protein n=1 Tax=Aphanomyces stellatus TaxID=120398 RepID=A0A485KR44_9STRA|nr:hypothetical protein As57867_010692 [Aphanomyces stellatus]VFT87602.1 Aste57867_10732 [Aphanomyces stellatus]
MRLYSLCFLLAHGILASPAPRDSGGFGLAQHVIVFGLDGLDVRCLHKALTQGIAPNLQFLRDHGLVTDMARNERPALSLPNWATIFYGAGVMFHGVLSDDWSYCTRRQDYASDHPPSWDDDDGDDDSNDDSWIDFIPPYLGDCVVYPDLFTVVKQQRPELQTAMYYSWANLDAILPADVVTVDTRRRRGGTATNNGCDNTIEASDALTSDVVAAIAADKMPHLVFLHLAEVDECAHESKCFSPHGQTSIATADANIGRVLAAVRAAGRENATVILLVTNHGRNFNGKHHGDDSQFNFRTQWLVYGQGIVQGNRTVKSVVSIQDTAPTVAHFLGIRAPVEWRGRVPEELFLVGNETVYSAATEPWGTCLKLQARKNVSSSWLALLGCLVIAVVLYYV